MRPTLPGTLALSTLLRAQRDTATIASQMHDSTLSAVPGAKITVKELVRNFERTTSSNSEGFNVLPALPAGDPRILQIGLRYSF